MRAQLCGLCGRARALLRRVAWDYLAALALFSMVGTWPHWRGGLLCVAFWTAFALLGAASFGGER